MAQMVKFQVRMPEPLREQAKRQAEKMGINLSLVVRLKLQEWLRDPNNLSFELPEEMEDLALRRAMDEARTEPALNREDALAFLETDE